MLGRFKLLRSCCRPLLDKTDQAPPECPQSRSLPPTACTTCCPPEPRTTARACWTCCGSCLRTPPDSRPSTSARECRQPKTSSSSPARPVAPGNAASVPSSKGAERTLRITVPFRAICRSKQRMSSNRSSQIFFVTSEAAVFSPFKNLRMHPHHQHLFVIRAVEDSNMAALRQHRVVRHRKSCCNSVPTAP